MCVYIFPHEIKICVIFNSIPFHSYNNDHSSHHFISFHFTSLHLLGQSPALNGKDDAIFTLDTNCRTSTSYRLHGVLDLKQMPVGTEYCDGSVVTHANNIIYIVCLYLFVYVSVFVSVSVVLME